MNFPRSLPFATILGLQLLIPPILSAQGVVYLEQSDDFQAKIEANPPGTTFVVRSGIHRGHHMEPKDGSTIIGEPGAILSGSLVLTNWRYEAPYWVHDGPLPHAPSVSLSSVVCALPTCVLSQDMYKDGEFLIHALNLSDVNYPGAWYWDTVADRVYIRFDPAQHLVELAGQHGSAVSSATSRPGYGKNLTIKNLTVERYPSPPLSGAASAQDGALFEDCEFRYNHADGVHVSNNSTIRRCFAHHNGQTGIAVGGPGVLLEDNESSFNVRDEFRNAWQNGGIKSIHTTNLISRRNYSHHNRGVGLWTDVDSKDSTYEGNISEDNEWEGIIIEISCGAVVRNNVFRNNGLHSRGALWGAQICVQNAKNIEIHHNYCESPLSSASTSNGIVFINQGRGSGECGLWFCDHSYVHDNVIVAGKDQGLGMSYGTTGWNTYSDFLASGHAWERNHYHIGRPLATSWSWWTAQHHYPVDYFSTGFTYTDWLALGQDAGSTMQTHTPEFFAPRGAFIPPLIASVIDFDYQARKSSLTHSPSSNTDTDLDGLPDWWEKRYLLAVTGNGAANDPDNDGLTNLQEFQLGTNPVSKDSDTDQLPDGWEVQHQLNPLFSNYAEDPDNDTLTNYEEFEAGTNPQTAETLTGGLPENALGFWAKVDSQLTTDSQGNVTAWQDLSPAHRSLSVPAGTRVEPANFPIPGLRSVVGPLGIFSLSSTSIFTNNDDEGFTLFLVLQPRQVDSSRTPRAVFTNELYHQSGFRLLSKAGYFTLNSIEDGGTLSLDGVEPLAANQPTMLCISYGGKNGNSRSALYLMGKEQSVTTGRINPSSGTMGLSSIGGLQPQAAGYSEFIVFNRQLSHLQRRTVDRMLLEKYFVPAAPRLDTDFDGMPDTYELANGLDPFTTNGLGDKDSDGLSNLGEFQNDTNPSVPDTDFDGMPDGWEVAHQVNPLLNDAGSDPDGDLLTNLEEYRDASDPQIATSVLSALPFRKLALWLKADQGIINSTTSPVVSSWMDQSGRNRHALPASGPGVALSTAPVNAHLPPSAGAGALLASKAASDLVVGTEGFTIVIVIRPSAAATDATSRVLAGQAEGATGGFKFGFQNGHFRWWATSRNGTLDLLATASAAAGMPFIASMQYGGSSRVSALSVDGIQQTFASNASILPCPGGFRIGAKDGEPAANADVVECMIFREPLLNRERRAIEAYLQGKWLNSGPAFGDTDGDSIPDWWELEYGASPVFSNASADMDYDGITNLEAFHQGIPGFKWADLDNDGMLDSWERSRNLNTSLADGDVDRNNDGISNLMEFTLGLTPAGGTLPSSALEMAVESTDVHLSYNLNRSAWFTSLRPEWSQDLDTPTWQANFFEHTSDTPLSASERVEYKSQRPLSPLGRCFYRLRLQKNE